MWSCAPANPDGFAPAPKSRGAPGPSVGRPHIARALVEKGYVSSLQEAFDRYIATGGPAYVPRVRMSPPEVIGEVMVIVPRPETSVARITESTRDIGIGTEVVTGAR